MRKDNGLILLAIPFQEEALEIIRLLYGIRPDMPTGGKRDGKDLLLSVARI